LLIKHRLTLLVLPLLFTLNIVHAEPEPMPSPWSGTAQIGYTGTGGNSNDNNVNGKLGFVYKQKQWTNSYNLSALYSNSNSVISAQRYASTFESVYNFEETLFSFLRNDSFYDEFNPYDISITTAAGLGARLYNDGKVSVDLQGGPGYRSARVAGTDIYEKNMIGYLASEANWNISKTASFQQNLSAQIGENNTQSTSESALSVSIVGNLGLQVSYSIVHNSKIPPSGTKTVKTDYRTSVTLLFSF
jgi:putative salt-induced outer membrane protein